MNNDVNNLRKIINELLIERMTKWSEEPWLVSAKKLTITAPEGEGGMFQVKDSTFKVNDATTKNALNTMLNMNVPDPKYDEMARKHKENKAKPNPWINPDGSMADTEESEYVDEWGRVMTPAKWFREKEYSAASPERRKEILKKEKEESAELLAKKLDEPTRAFESLRSTIRNILKEELDPFGPMRRLASGEEQIHQPSPEFLEDLMLVKNTALELLNVSPSMSFEELFRAIEEQEGSMDRHPADPNYAQVELAWDEFSR